jgi:DNA-binding MarR family transcriptional regulator
MNSTPASCAAAVLETAPSIMRTIRHEFRKHRSPDLSVPQFRALAFMGRRGNASLSQLAEHIGVALPSASKLVDGLVSKKFAKRETRSKDRRQLELTLTSKGAAVLQTVRREAQAQLTLEFSQLSDTNLKTIEGAMDILQTLFSSNHQKCSKS